MKKVIAGLLGTLFVQGCGSQAGDDQRRPAAEWLDPVSSEDAELLTALEMQGYPTDKVVIREDDIVVDGDMVFSKKDLREFNEQVRDKGYFCGGSPISGTPSFKDERCWGGGMILNPEVAKRLWINFGASFASLPGPWYAAAIDAADRWNMAHNNGFPAGIHIDAALKHPSSWAKGTITITALDGLCPANFFACTDGGPRGLIANANYVSTPANINIEPANVASFDVVQMRHTLMHELGHTLGFLHPGDTTNGVLIADSTAESGTTAGYGTVMRQGALEIPVLQPDDLFSVAKMYPQAATGAPVFSMDPASFNWDFCTDAYPCDAGEGDCDIDSQCKGSLVCAQDVGAAYGFDPTADLCVPSNFPGGDSSRGTCPTSTTTGKCAVLGCPCERLEGDCDNDQECAGRLVCGSNHGNAGGRNGPAFGKSSGWDFCIEPPNPGCPWFVPSSPHTAFCSTGCPCDAGQGDCDTHNECRAGLVCGRDLGASFGLPSNYDVCVLPAFAVNGTDG